MPVVLLHFIEFLLNQINIDIVFVYLVAPKNQNALFSTVYKGSS